MRQLLHRLRTFPLRLTASTPAAAAALQSLVPPAGASPSSSVGNALVGADGRQTPPHVYSYSTNAAQLFPQMQARLQAALQPAVCMQLPRHGYVVLDNVLGADACDTLRHEVQQLHAQGRMHLNHTHLVRDNATQLLPKAAIYEAELSLDPQVSAAAPLFSRLEADRTLQTMLSLLLPQLRLDSHAIKLQLNEGNGGCFPMHFDSDEELDGRRITAIFYLNPGWQQGQGGELRLYPFPDAGPVDIAPVADRLVLFSSTRMLHRVLPSSVERCCFTIWLSERRGRSAVRQPVKLAPPEPFEFDSILAGKASYTGGEPGGTQQDRIDQIVGSAPGGYKDRMKELLRFLLQPAVRQHVCKLVYADEWRASIEDSHPPSPARDAALATHDQEVDTITRALAKYGNIIMALAESCGSNTPQLEAALDRLHPSYQLSHPAGQDGAQTLPGAVDEVLMRGMPEALKRMVQLEARSASTPLMTWL